MQNKKLSLQQRLRIAFTGETKAFIPPLPDIDGLDSSAPLATFETKTEQLRKNIGWVFAANSAIVDDVAAVPLKLYRKKKDGDREEILEHEILDLINKEPSLVHDGESMRVLLHTYRNLTGEAFLLMRRDGVPTDVRPGRLPQALEILPSHVTEFKLGKERYTDSTVRFGQTDYPIAEVLRSFIPNPADPYQGRSIISAAAAPVDSDEQMQSWNRRMFQNNARPGLIFNLTGDNVDSEVYDRLKSQVEEMYTNDGVFRSLVVENGEVKPYMLNQQDLDFLNSRAFTRDEILAMFKVPSAMLGMSKDYNRANIDGARYIHYLTNVVPRLRREVSMWNRLLVQPYDPTLELGFVNPIPEDVEARLNEAKAGTNTWMTIDEVRAERGMEPLPDKLGEQLYVPINSVPLASIATTLKPQPAQDANGNPSEGKKSLPKPKTPTAKT